MLHHAHHQPVYLMLQYHHIFKYFLYREGYTEINIIPDVIGTFWALYTILWFSRFLSRSKGRTVRVFIWRINMQYRFPFPLTNISVKPGLFVRFNHWISSKDSQITIEVRGFNKIHFAKDSLPYHQRIVGLTVSFL